MANTFEKHFFFYEMDGTQVPEQADRNVLVTIADPNLPQILEAFEAYLRAVGYVPPDNSHLDWVADKTAEEFPIIEQGCPFDP